MLTKHTTFYTLFFACLIVLASADFEDIVTIINSVSTVLDSTDNKYKSLSMKGGAYLYIKGSGFSTRSASSNRVTVGDVDCPVIGKPPIPFCANSLIEFLTTSTQVVCQVPPSNSEKSAQVSVFSDDTRVGTCGSCWVYYSYWATPLLAYMIPSAGNPGQEVSYYGRSRVSTSEDVDYVKIGDYRCDPTDQNEFDAVTFDGSYRPAPCNVPPVEAGYYNVTQRNLKNTGFANKLTSLPVYRSGDYTYDFAVVPEITSISNNLGSIQGQIITVKGKGFSSTNQNEVSLGDTQCKILQQSETEIQCEVQPRTTTVSDQGYHAGMKFALYEEKSLEEVMAGTAGTATSTGVRLTSEIGYALNDDYASKLSGYFKAPVTGNYKFTVSADDRAQLLISKTPLVKTGLETILTIGSYTGYRMFFRSNDFTQISDSVALTADNYYYMELYHQDSSGDDYATIGVIVPGSTNTVNTVPEAKSIKITCPTIPEILEIKISNPTGGNWRVRLDYLSSDGKQITSVSKTGDISYKATAATVSNMINWGLGLKNTATRTMLKSDGTETTTESEAATFIYTVTLQSLRKNGKMPVIEITDLTGTGVDGQISQTQAPSAPVRGTFSISGRGTPAQMNYNVGTGEMENKLREMGYLDPIRVTMSGDVDLGAEWHIQFSGDKAPFDQITVSNTLTGCSNPAGINTTVSTLQSASNDLFYEVIPFDLLYTAEQNPQITIKSNGVRGNCPAGNCDYTLQTSGIPEIIAASFSAPTLTLTVDGVTTNQYTSAKLRVFFGNTECTVSSYTDASIPATLIASCSGPEAGDFTPRVHFTGLGYSKAGTGLSPITVDAVISGVSPSQINTNGGTVLTVTGTGFPASIAAATLRNLDVKIGSASCNLQSVTATQIVCESTAVAADSALTVSLNSKTGTSTTLTLLSAVPTIDTVTPNTANPVLQTDIVIAGSNFDSDVTSTSVILSNTTHSKVAECLPVAGSSSTTQITCKLLGAPTGSYSFKVKTSLGFSNTKTFTVKTSISGVSPSSGSAAGGTLLTITGGSFSTDKQQTLVFVGDENLACDVVSSAASQVQCLTRPKKASYTNDSPQDIVVATRIVEEAVCDSGATCTFAYSDSLTPKVTALGATSVSPSDNIVITGSGFTSNPAGTAPTVTVGGTTCTIVANTDTQITATIPASFIPNKAVVLAVNIAGKGNALFSSVNSTIQVTPKISSVSPSSAASTGALLTINGAGFQPGTIIKVGPTTVCAIRSLTSTTITCRATSTGQVSLTYGGFSNIKCASGCSLTSTTINIPTITSVSPLTPASASSFTLTIVGTKFDTGVVAINLVSNVNNNIVFAGSVTSSTATQIDASFSNIAAGTYAVEVLIGANAVSSTNSVNVPLSATVSGALESSIAGGATLTITGSGFFDNAQKDSNAVSVCGLPCTVTQSSASSIQCQVPLYTNAAVETAYPDLVAASLLKAPVVWSDSGNHSSALDLAFTTSYSSSIADCQIGFDIGSGLLAEISEIKYFPDPATTASKLSGTVIEGSNNNSTFTTISTIDANAHDGWNTITLTSTAKYRYYRLRGATSTAKCALSELQFFGTVLSDSTTTNLEALTCTAQVTVNDKTQSVSSAVTYKQSKTPTLTSVSPKMGTTAGGTTLTLTGTGFITTTTNIQVLIDDIPCTVSSATSTVITCVTGAAPTIANRKSSLDSKLTIRFTGQGDVVVGTNKYFYVDKWSEMSTWGGITPPREGESVSIPAGQTILLDTSPPKLKAIIIEGALVFNDQDLTLDAEYIFIRNGRLQIGTKENPIQSKIVVTLHGTYDSPQLPTFGNKVIALMEGILDIHGKERSHTWTVLDSTANIGATSITVQEEVDWQQGEQIVIASTDHDHYMSESRTILTATKNSGTTTITFADPLKNKHYAGNQTIGGVTFEMRAEVGLLTRNVVIQGDEQSQKLKYGVHIMAHSPTGDDSSIARVSYTEVRQAGQAFNLGRYALHLHMIGNVRESYIIGNAVHHSYNRAVTIHGVHFLKVQKNVAYWVMGHTIFIEDGIETHNVIEDNLVINTIASTALLNTDQTPASFWITNPNNIWRRNHAAGSDRYGFWFDLREHPEGPSATTSICPTGERLGEFTDNQAHSCGRYGLRIFHEHIPRTYPCEPYDDAVANPPIQAEYTNFLGWKNMRDAVIGERLGAIKFKNIKAADNKRAGIEISDGNRSPADTLLIEDAWIVGKTPDNAGDDSVYIDGQTRGIITPKVDFFLAKNVHFYNFGPSMTAIETCSHCEHPAATDAGARTSFFQGLTFSNVDQRVRFNVPLKEILVDRDGSLTGSGSPGTVTHYYEHLDVPGCTRNEAVYNGLVCDSTVTIRRVEFLGLVPFGGFEMQNLEILRVESNTNSLIGNIPYRQKNRKSWAAHFVTGYTHKLSWASRADFNELVITPSDVMTASDKAITISFNHSEYRELFDIYPSSKDVKSNISNQTTLWTTTTANNLNNGDWYHDVTAQDLYMVINGKTKQELKVQSIKCRLNCPIPVGNVPKEGFTRSWSNATQWPGGVVPGHGANVEVPGNWSLKLDVSTANLSTLHVMGDLFYDNTKDDLVITAERIWVEGQIFIGTGEEDRFTRNAKIRLTGNRKSKSLILGEVQDVSNKVLAVTGNVTMFGALVNNVFVKLQAPAKVGATSITVPSDVDWKVGDMIVIGPSQRAHNESEVRVISAIANGVITLNDSLAYYHFGASSVTKTTTIGDIDMRAEVGLLTRNIVVEGTEEDSWGGRIYVGEIYDPNLEYYYRGRVNLDGVQMVNFGQANTTLAGLTLDRLVSANNDASVIRRCAITSSLGYEMKVVGSTGITFENNLLFKSQRIQAKFEDENTNIIFKNNLLLYNEDRGLKSDKGDMVLDFGASFYSDAKFVNSDISENIVAGCFQQCWLTLGGDCTAQADGPYTVSNNVAHSGQVGWLVKEPSALCHAITHFTGWRLEQGIATMFQSKNLQGSNLIITDTEKGISLNIGGVLDTTTISLTNSYAAGVTPTGDLDGYTNKTECSNLAGILLPASVTGAKQIPPSPSSLPWYKVKSDHIWQSTYTMSGVTLENFDDTIVSGCVNNYGIRSNHYASDASASTKMSGMTLINVNANNKIFFEKPDIDWIGIDDCGGWFCTGISNILVRDLDGSFTGGSNPASLMPANNSILDSSTCTYSEKQNANICTDKGWGLLVIESLDIDVLTRILSPVYVTSTNYFNALNNYMDHVWDGFYTGLKRYSRFHSVVQTGKQYEVKFTSTLPNNIRWGLQGALPSETATVLYGYPNPQSVKVTNKAGAIISPIVVKNAADKVIKTTDPCGTNIYDLDTRKVTVQLTGEADCRLSIAITNAIKATIRFELTVDEFFAQDGPATFVDKMAVILKINPASIRVVDIKSGSTKVFFFVDSTHQESTPESDAAAKAELEALITLLGTAQSNGQLEGIFNSRVLDSSFELALVRPSTDTIISGSDIAIVIVAAVVGVLALAVGSFFAYRKYARNKIIPGDVDLLKPGAKLPENSAFMHTENPLVSGSRFDLLASPTQSQNFSPTLKIEVHSPSEQP